MSYGLCYRVVEKAIEADMIRAILPLIVCIAVWLVGCAASRPIEPSPVQKALIGKTKQELASCAGPALGETKTAEGTVLKYYKEAPMLEESSAFLKSSRPGVHHGCWASLLLTDDRVEGVEYRSVPRSVDATDHCDEIFQACAH
jgi:hypothetical protein